MGLHSRYLYLICASLFFFVLVLMPEKVESFEVSFDMDVIREETQKYQKYLKHKWIKTIYNAVKRKKKAKTNVCKWPMLQKLTLCQWIMNSNEFRRLLRTPVSLEESRYECYNQEVLFNGESKIRILPMVKCPPLIVDRELDYSTTTTVVPYTYFLSGTATKDAVLVFMTTIYTMFLAPKAFVYNIDMKTLKEVVEFVEVTELSPETEENFLSAEDPENMGESQLASTSHAPAEISV